MLLGAEPSSSLCVCLSDTTIFNGVSIMKGILLWLVGIPIPIIILLYLFNVL